MPESGPATVAPAFQARVEPAGWSFAASAGAPLLQSAEAAGIALPSSCRNGTCRTCVSRLLAGEIAYRIEWPGLSAEEKADGWILPCVAHPLSDVVLRQPGARHLFADDR